MRLRLIGLAVMITAIAIAAGASMAGATSTSCGITFRVHPGVGETLVSNIAVSGVTCAKAHFAIGRYEHSLKHAVPLKISGTPFTCTRHRVGSPEDGITNVSCAKGAKRVSWRSAYGI